MATELKSIHTTKLKCNCPECFSTSGLQLGFNQEWKENFWLKKATHVVREELKCNHCDFPIYPVKWTPDIERQYEYHLKLAVRERYFKLKSKAYFVMLAGVILITLGVWVWLNR